MRELGKIITVKPEPETTPSLSDIIQKEKALQTVSDYFFTPALRAHFKRIFDSVVHQKGQGFWVQAEYGAGKTHFLGTLVDLLVWRELNVWEALGDAELRSEYSGALSKIKWFPIAFSLRGMGESGEADSLMRVFEEQIRESLKTFATDINDQVNITSAELADYWFQNEASDAEKAGVKFFFEKEHKCSPEEYRSTKGKNKFGQELVRSKLPEGRLRGKFKERFAYIYEQITKLGGYNGMIFIVDEFRSWQDRHPQGTPAYAEDEEVLETLAYVLPTEHLNIITIIASQGDMPQKLSGGGEGDRFVPLYLLADKNKGDFGEIVTFRCRDLQKGASTDIKDYYDHCRKEYRFIKQANISADYFSGIFPFQPRCFDVMQRITQNAEKHNLPTARSAIRMAWQTLADPELLKCKRLITLSDIINTDELRKGLNHEHYRDAYQNLQSAIEQLGELDVGTEEREQCKAILQTLLLWALSLPDNLRDGLTAQEVAEAAWLQDDAVGARAQAEHLLDLLIQNGLPVRKEKKSRAGEDLAVYAYETSVVQVNPVRFYAPLKKKYLQDIKRQDEKWLESLFWDLTVISSRGKNAGKPIMRKRAVARGCGAEIVLWYAMANPDEENAETPNLCCPKCHQMWEKVDLPFVRITPVAADYTFKNPSALRRRERRKITAKELRRIAEATPERWHVWFPQHRIYPYRELMTMSANKRGIISTADFYTRRNLAALGLLWSEINTIADERVRIFARFAFTAIIPYCCRKQNYGGGGGGMSGTLYLPSFHQEKNVWSVFERKVRKLIDEFRGREYLPPNVVVLKRSASQIGIGDQSVDYIFADPPFGGNIFYSDASILWESWLDDFTNEAAEMVYHRRSRQQRQRDGYTFKTIEDYSNDMALAFAEMFRVLKPGRWATIEFNNSDGLVFEAIKGAIRKAGFEIANMLLFDKAQKSFKQVKGATGEEDVVDKDVVFNLHKPAFATSENRREEHDLEQQVADAIRQHLLTLPERIKTDPGKYNDEHRTTATINSMLMNTLIPRGVSVDRLNLPFIERVCARYFRRVGQHWYLRGEAVGSNGGGTLIAEEISIKDEVTGIAWLRQKLDSGPMLIGELKPLWMRATGLLTTEVSQGLVLENLLSENFWRDSDTNRWREPTSEERERMNDDRSLRVLHDAERFVSGTLNRSTTDEERCKWIDVLFQACRAIEDNEIDALPALRGFDKAEAYGIILRLFQSVLRDHVSKEVYNRAEKQARAASRRIAPRAQEGHAEQIKAKAGSDANQGRFDFDKST